MTEVLAPEHATLPMAPIAMPSAPTPPPPPRPPLPPAAQSPAAPPTPPSPPAAPTAYPVSLDGTRSNGNGASGNGASSPPVNGNKAPERETAEVGGGTLDARNVSAWFSGRKVLERCSLHMRPGRVTALIGPSGCGKSTFLRILNRMHELVPGAELSGSVELDGSDIYDESMAPADARSRVGMVFQKPNPFPSMSIAENVLAGLHLTGRKANPDDVVEESLTRAGIWTEVKDRLHDGGMSLSGGQQQRLCIARALAVRPKVLLMDEPCSALDPISTKVIEATIRELCHEITIVIVTHNMQQAQRVSDDCAFFLVEEFGQPGRIVESGLSERLFSNPSDQRTLDYISGRFG